MSSYTSDKRSARKGAASAKREISSIERELSYVDDPSTQQSLRERIEYLKDVIKLSKEKEQSLRGEFENIDRR
jgi:molecular chaperone GrpE (heat shock protein)